MTASTQVICACSTAVAIVAQLLLAGIDSPAIWPIWLVYAMTATFFSMVQPYVGMAFPASLSGRALTGYNLLVFSGTFGWQWLYGVVIDVYRSLGHTDASAYRRTMATAVVVQVIALIVFLVWSPKPPAERMAGTS